VLWSLIFFCFIKTISLFWLKTLLNVFILWCNIWTKTCFVTESGYLDIIWISKLTLEVWQLFNLCFIITYSESLLGVETILWKHGLWKILLKLLCLNFIFFFKHHKKGGRVLGKSVTPIKCWKQYMVMFHLLDNRFQYVNHKCFIC